MIRQDDLIDSVNRFLAAPPHDAWLLLLSCDPARLWQVTYWLVAAFG